MQGNKQFFPNAAATSQVGAAVPRLGVNDLQAAGIEAEHLAARLRRLIDEHDQRQQTRRWVLADADADVKAFDLAAERIDA